MFDLIQRFFRGMAAILVYSPSVIFLMLVFWSFAFSLIELVSLAISRQPVPATFWQNLMWTWGFLILAGVYAKVVAPKLLGDQW